MNRFLAAVLSLFALLLCSARAVETGSTYQSEVPTDTQVPNWSTGWNGTGITGWNYVGTVGDASGVYLGNGWVLTAGHVGAGTFTLNGISYQPVAGSNHSFSNSNGTADLTLFQISTFPVLNPLTISQNAPIAFSQQQAGSSVVLIGYGGGHGETWGYDTVDLINQLIQPSGYSYVSNDFITIYGTYTSGTATSTNNSNLVGGDSGGGDFIFNTTTQAWELAGINEVTGTGTINSKNVTISGYVQLSTYAAQINAIVIPPLALAADSPALPTSGLLILGCLLLFSAFRSFPNQTRN